MVTLTRLSALALLCLPTLTKAEVSDPASAAAVMAEACVTDALDWDANFAQAKGVFAAQGLQVMAESDQLAQFGLPGTPGLMATRTVDSLACRLDLPGTAEVDFEAIRDTFGAAVLATYPEALSVPGNTASPHDEKHEWVISVPGEKHFAATLQWTSDRGIMLSVGYRQVYE